MLLFWPGQGFELMGDVAKGIKAFKKGMSDDETLMNDRRDPARREPAHARGPAAAAAAAAAGVQSPVGERKAS